MIERDYIMRMIQQLANALARIMGARKQEKYDEVQKIIDDAYGEILGLSQTLVGVMNAESLTQLLGDGDKIKVLARLLKEEGELCELRDDPAQATIKYEKSFALYLETYSRQTKIDLESESMIKALLDKIDFEQLSIKYQGILKKMRAASASG